MPIFRKIVAEWQRRETTQTIWRIPNDVYSNIKKIKAALVKESERAAFVKKGRVILVVPSGEHPLLKETDEIVWVDVSRKSLPFGIPKYRRLLTRDQHEIGFSGKLTLKVGNTEGDIKKFLTKAVGNKSSLSYDELTKWLRDGPLVSVFRGFVGKVAYEDFVKIEPYEIAHRVVPQLADELSKYGLQLVSIDITGVAH